MSAGKSEWREKTLEPARQRFKERQEAFETEASIAIDAVYTPEDQDGFDYAEKLGYPGEFPYARGVQPNMYRGRVWTMRQYSGYASAEESNRRYRYLLGQGPTSPIAALA